MEVSTVKTNSDQDSADVMKEGINSQERIQFNKVSL